LLANTVVDVNDTEPSELFTCNGTAATPSLLGESLVMDNDRDRDEIDIYTKPTIDPAVVLVLITFDTANGPRMLP
jgi:hypothetical protein